MKVAVAMSGGVDSSVTAALLLEQGHEVIGLTMKTHAVAPGPRMARSCCSPEDLGDARRVADRLGIDFYVLNVTEAFRDEIVQPFAEAYARGETPNPCVDCNDRIKFRPLLARAEALAADRLATGHYARILGGTHAGEPVTLERGLDRRKDQTYFLFRLQRSQLARLLFPLGAMTKPEVREAARRFGLPVADKEESQEICFVGEAGYADLVEQTVETPGPGDIVDRHGHKLGRHAGIHRYTLGQRRGLGIAAPHPLYVTEIDASRNLVRVGPPEDLLTDAVEATQLSWVGEPPVEGAAVQVQQRYREQPKPARVEWPSAERIRIVFDEPAPRGAPGQAAVLFDNDRVLGGGTLARDPSRRAGVAA